MISQERSELVEALAQYSHEVWTEQLSLLFRACVQPTINRNDHVGGLLIPPELVAKLARRLCVPYDELSMDEKDKYVSEAWRLIKFIEDSTVSTFKIEGQGK